MFHKIIPADVIVAKKDGYKKTLGETQDLPEVLAQHEAMTQHGAEFDCKF